MVWPGLCGSLIALAGSHRLPPAERVAEATLYGVTRKCPCGTSNSKDPTYRENFRVPEERLARDNTETGKEDVEVQRGAEERKGMMTEQQESNRDSSKDTDIEESSEEEEEENRGSGGEDVTLGVGAGRRLDRKEYTTRRPRHVPGGM
ncbi:hypothetical protein NDU88_001297 [Pleurodeles waltl]|uniref:Uncharacterized protein n=1 Tax=Pleurodeles waltl TaxID=8319 RepID=A0AAV7M2S6_PLEWA|nr:hypothetical protein NDU88_001297 [Pleurodeles waltl]